MRSHVSQWVLPSFLPPRQELKCRRHFSRRSLAGAAPEVGHALGARTILLATRDLLSLSDDELQLVHEAIPGHTLWCCVLCCKRLRIAALASGGLAHAAAVAGDLASMKRAHLRGCPLSRAAWAGTLCHIAAARNDLTMLRWALANGGVGPHGSVVMELAIEVGNLEMARAIHEHGCVYDIGRAYETAAVRDTYLHTKRYGARGWPTPDG